MRFHPVPLLFGFLATFLIRISIPKVSEGRHHDTSIRSYR
nr:MAG TPA_asm: hypothetical protein [Caudoviricetes sp.]